MKRISAVVLSLFLFCNAALAEIDGTNSQEKTDYSLYPFYFAFGVGTVGYEANIQNAKPEHILHLFKASVLDFYIHENSAGFGIKFSPLVFLFGYKDADEKSRYKGLSPLNVEFFWSPLRMYEGMTAGPYASMSYLLGDENDFIFKSGIKFALFKQKELKSYANYVLNWTTIELGYSRINSSNNYYVNINVDIVEAAYAIIGVFTLIVLASLSSKNNEYQDDHVNAPKVKKAKKKHYSIDKSEPTNAPARPSGKHKKIKAD
ncbi:MAG: hypothetical protein LBU09_02760 [Endomicrobium sp.]|jgi:hypothetical protein|nr:hypothetical protein [Endomicrobium sp.]